MEDYVICALSGAKVHKNDASQGFTIRPSIMNLIRKRVPSFDENSWILNKHLKEFKLQYVQSLAADESMREISAHVANAVATHDFLAVSYLDTINQQDSEDSAYDLFIDKVADFGGSMWFVGGFIVFVIVWALVNSFMLVNGFDAYPYALLSLILGCIGSLQAPFIMMSQNRAARQDRKQALNDYKVNLKSEFELSILREKLDHVINNQNPRLLEVIALQQEAIEELLGKIEANQRR